MHTAEPYDLVQPPQPVSFDGEAGVLLARWRGEALVLLDGSVAWVPASRVRVDWAPWSTALAANA